MRTCWLVVLLGVVLPLATSFITYTFISAGVNALDVGETGALVIILVLVKLMFLSTQGYIPVDIDKILEEKGKRGDRDERSVLLSRPRRDNTSLYQVPEVDVMPCTRRFLCEIEATVRTSDNYLPRGPDTTEGRNPEEEVAPEDVDPLTEMQIEAIRALYREDDPTGELTHRSRRAVQAVEGLTGTACETAYRLCPGRFTTPAVFWTLFEEINLVVHEGY